MRFVLIVLSSFGLGLGWTVVAAAARPVKELTVLVYAAGDEEEIHEPTNDSLKRFERISGLTPGGEVTIVAQHDDTGKDKNYRYVFQYQANPNAKNIGPDTAPVPEKEIQQFEKEMAAYAPFRVAHPFRYQERDSGNPVTLKQFIKWGVTAYPARHYILILAGHSWGQQGIMQDFFVHGRNITPSTLLKNYEVRRVMEEVYRELNTLPGRAPLIPEGKFDLLVLDGCVFGQLDVLSEHADVFKYFVGSTLETPFHSIPFNESFGPYVDWLNAHPGRKDAAWDHDFEERLLKPMVVNYVGNHVRGGGLVKPEHQIDIVEAMAVRLDRLEPVEAALRALVAGMPEEAKEAWHDKRIRSLELLRDSDSNADLWELATDFADYFEKRFQESGQGEWDTARKLALNLREALGSPARNPVSEPVAVKHPSAIGAWAHVQIDELVKPRDMAACIALKSFAMQNQWDSSIPQPVFHDKDGKEVSATDLNCDDWFGDYQKTHKGKRYRSVYDHSTAIKQLFGTEVDWSASGVPAYLTEVKAKSGRGVGQRYLSIWIPRDGRTLDRQVRLRLPATEEVTLEYVTAGNPVDSLKSDDRVERWHENGTVLHFPAYVAFTLPSDFRSATNPGLYVAEAHTNGAYFKRGMGIFLNHTLDSGGAYQGGRLPIERVDPDGTLEQYMAELSHQHTLNKFKIKGAAFYRAHRINESLWPDFLFGPNDIYYKDELRQQRHRKFLLEHRKESQDIELED